MFRSDAHSLNLEADDEVSDLLEQFVGGEFDDTDEEDEEADFDGIEDFDGFDDNFMPNDIGFELPPVSSTSTAPEQNTTYEEVFVSVEESTNVQSTCGTSHFIGFME
ncbi:uncharacterized protein LOC129571511 [Sitodiplosis mosellana]|uniref:uncharacterized protein LOC129571511 n=1 Tax=Sitodiplosis mosellana TaxID=263140 RepID=UPI0024438B15|nr:uncharacterized protein LOC129571511 [Sitodiplosis mosellana]